jgi:hypothetical protein
MPNTHNFRPSAIRSFEAVGEASPGDLGLLHLVGVYHEGDGLFKLLLGIIAGDS